MKSTGPFVCVHNVQNRNLLYTDSLLEFLGTE